MGENTGIESLFHVAWTVISFIIGLAMGLRFARKEEARRGCFYSWIEWIDERHRIPCSVTRSDTIRGQDIREAVLRDEARKTTQERE